jgi:hypothetical protein
MNCNSHQGYYYYVTRSSASVFMNRSDYSISGVQWRPLGYGCPPSRSTLHTLDGRYCCCLSAQSLRDRLSRWWYQDEMARVCMSLEAPVVLATHPHRRQYRHTAPTNLAILLRRCRRDPRGADPRTTSRGVARGPVDMYGTGAMRVLSVGILPGGHRTVACRSPLCLKWARRPRSPEGWIGLCGEPAHARNRPVPTPRGLLSSSGSLWTASGKQRGSAYNSTRTVVSPSLFFRPLEP